jgi:uncharacterized protein YndB with AHSA1/START domain
MNQPQPITATIDIGASPDRVWAVVSDFVRMAEWSPECRRIMVPGEQKTGVGARFLGLNRRRWVAWPTSSTIVRFEPSRAIAWQTRESGARWTYELDATGSGTRLTGRRDLADFTVLTKLFAPVIGGAAGHDEELADGIRTTLARIKATVEQDAALPHA